MEKAKADIKAKEPTSVITQDFKEVKKTTAAAKKQVNKVAKAEVKESKAEAKVVAKTA